jgi:hypothetical protein
MGFTVLTRTPGRHKRWQATAASSCRNGKLDGQLPMTIRAE